MLLQQIKLKVIKYILVMVQLFKVYAHIWTTIQACIVGHTQQLQR